MNKSIDYLKENPPKNWWSAPIVVLLTFFVAQAVGGIILAPIIKLFAKDMSNDNIMTFAGLYSFIFALAFMLYYVKKINKVSINSLGYFSKNALIKYLTGVLVGIIVIGTIMLTVTLLGGFTFKVSNNISWIGIFAAFIGFAFQGMTEEVMCRGYIQNRVASVKGMWFGVIANSLVFTALHSANPGITILPVINLFVFGLLFSLLFWLTDSMWLIGATHTTWNFLLGPVLGVEVSGNIFAYHIFETKRVGGDLLTGGKFGLEGSIFTTIIGLAFCVIFYVLIKKKERNLA